MSIVSTVLFILTALMLLLILIVSLRFILRKDYTRRLLALPTPQKERITRSEKTITTGCKVVFWLGVFILVFLTIPILLYFPEIFTPFAICMVIFFVMVGMEYIFHKWILNFLERN